MHLWSGVSHKLWFCHSLVITSLRLYFVASHSKTLYKLNDHYRDMSLKKATNQEIRKIPLWLATTICISWEWREIQLENTWLNLLSSRPPKTKKSDYREVLSTAVSIRRSFICLAIYHQTKRQKIKAFFLQVYKKHKLKESLIKLKEFTCLIVTLVQVWSEKHAQFDSLHGCWSG